MVKIRSTATIPAACEVVTPKDKRGYLSSRPDQEDVLVDAGRIMWRMTPEIATILAGTMIKANGRFTDMTAEDIYSRLDVGRASTAPSAAVEGRIKIGRRKAATGKAAAKGSDQESTCGFDIAILNGCAGGCNR